MLIRIGPVYYMERKVEKAKEKGTDHVLEMALEIRTNLVMVPARARTKARETNQEIKREIET